MLPCTQGTVTSTWSTWYASHIVIFQFFLFITFICDLFTQPLKYQGLKLKAAADSRGSFLFKCLFFTPAAIIRCISYILKIETWNKKYTFKNESIYPFHKFEENLPIFTNLSWRSFFIVFIFHSKFHFRDLFFLNNFCSERRPCTTKFGADCTFHCISSDTV